MIDAAGGAAEFADSVEAELPRIFGDAATAGLSDPLPPDTKPSANSPVGKSKTYRNYVRGKITGSLRAPRIHGFKFPGLKGSTKERIGVFLTAGKTLSAGIVGEPVDGVAGIRPALRRT